MEEDKKENIVIYTKAVRKLLGIKFDQFRRKFKKVGRNEKCPCGSGNKFKYCCKDESIANENKEKLTKLAA